MQADMTKGRMKLVIDLWRKEGDTWKHEKFFWYRYYCQCSQLGPYLGTQVLIETHFQNWVLIGSLFSLDIHISSNLLASILKWDWNWWLLKPFIVQHILNRSNNASLNSLECKVVQFPEIWSGTGLFLGNWFDFYRTHFFKKDFPNVALLFQKILKGP